MRSQKRTSKSGHRFRSDGPPGAKPEPKTTASLSPGRKWFFRLLAILVVPVAVLGAVEAGLRLAGYGYNPALFKEMAIDGTNYYVNNETFSLRFFPPQLTRDMGPVRMPVMKSPGTYRIFVMGESAAMGDPEPAYGPARHLEALLEARYPQTRFEIVNTGITAIDSHVILPIARECARHKGDLWIIYMGNNEMVGPFGAATVFGQKAPPLPLIRLDLAIQTTRLGQLLVNLGRRLHFGESEAPSWGGMEMFVGNQLSPDDPRKEVVYQNFARNLHDIIRAGLGGGAKILLNTVAVNLKDCAPFASLDNTNPPPADRLQFARFFTNAIQAQDRGDLAAAAHDYGAADAFDPQSANLQYRWAECLLGLGDDKGAHEHFQLACDDDALPFRTDSRLNALITASARNFGGGRVALFDAASALAADEPAGLLGDETFYEHVHFNFDGGYRLGLAWAEQVAKLLPPEIADNAATNEWLSQAACELRLGLSDWNRVLVWQEVIDRFKQPPLSSQLNSDARLKQLEGRVAAVKARMGSADEATTDTNFQAVIQKTSDNVVRENYALFLQSIGKLPEATQLWRQVQDWSPQDYVPYFQLGHLLALQKLKSEAEPELRRAVQIHPTLTRGWTELAGVQAAQGQYAEALNSYDAALKLNPQDGQTILLRGRVLAALNRHSEAMDGYREAIRLDPAAWEAHYELAGELDATGRFEEACREFGEAARLNPGYSRAHFNYGVLLAKTGRLDEAQREFEEALRLEPGYAKAQEYLAQVRALKQRAP